MTSTDKIIALLPIKKNSVRLPGKNFKVFDGKPLYYWITKTLYQLEFVDKIIINTDSTQDFTNFKEFRNNKIVIKNRKLHLRGDEISMNKIIEDDILDFKDNSFLMTHTTSPLINPLTLSMAKLKYEEVLRKNSHDSLFSVNSHKSRFFDSLGTPMNHDLKSLIPTQNLIPIYEENSAFYFFSYESFFRFKSRIGSRPYFYVTPKIESVDIDDSETWNLALTIKRGLNDNA